MGKTIGIDLGTTNSCVAVVEGGKPVIIPNDKGRRTTPSAVAFAKNGERHIGDSALRQAVVNSDRTVLSVKRRMGTDWHISVDGKKYSPTEISAMILRALRESAESYLGEKVTDAVITVPAYFNDIQRQATKDAGRIAGLNVKRIINEPTSAALAYGLDNGTPQKIMVYDLGGGTFDVSIIEIGDSVIEVIATNGDNHLGGDDFDDRVKRFLADEIKKTYKVDVTRDAAVMQRLSEAAEQAKIELSSSMSAYINLPYLTQTKSGIVNFEYTLSRAEFNGLTADLVEKTAGPVKNALLDAGIAASELGMVLLVGGSTRIPAVRDMVKKLTGKNPSQTINPDECVAVGAAVQGETLSKGSSAIVGGGGAGILLLDVTPLSLSIETVGGVATRLVERNSTLPVSYSQVFTTAAPYQSSVEIHVLQGERPMAADNKTIGRFRLTGIKRAPAGVPQIQVTFDIDANGILKVSAKDLDTGRSQSIVITDNNRMTDDEIRAAMRDAENYAETDRQRRTAIETVNDAGRTLDMTVKALDQTGSKLPRDTKKQIKADCKALDRLLSKKYPEKMTEEDIKEIVQCEEKLKSYKEILCLN